MLGGTLLRSSVGREKSLKEDTAAPTQRIGLLCKCTAATQKTAMDDITTILG